MLRITCLGSHDPLRECMFHTQRAYDDTEAQAHVLLAQMAQLEEILAGHGFDDQFRQWRQSFADFYDALRESRTSIHGLNMQVDELIEALSSF